jgi:hypothetical protein
MRSEHYYLPTVETANSVGISSLGLFLYPRSATRFTWLVLSHQERRIVALTVAISLRIVVIPTTHYYDQNCLTTGLV